MARLGLKARYPKRFKVTTDSNYNELISSNTLDQQFDVISPNQVWTTDITDVWTLQGWLYRAIVMDWFSRQIVGWAIADHMRTSLCVSALQMAFWRRKPRPGLLHHSDRGSPYASHEYRQYLRVMKMEQSMSIKAVATIIHQQNDSFVALNTNIYSTKNSKIRKQQNSVLLTMLLSIMENVLTLN